MGQEISLVSIQKYLEGTSTDLLTCTICMEPFNTVLRKPRLWTKCGHTFCDSCTNLCVFNRTPCPTCREAMVGTVLNYSLIEAIKLIEESQKTLIEGVKNREIRVDRDNLAHRLEQYCLEVNQQLYKTEDSLEDNFKNISRMATTCNEVEQKVKQLHDEVVEVKAQNTEILKLLKRSSKSRHTRKDSKR